jgi:hypothetical protein
MTYGACSVPYAATGHSNLPARTKRLNGSAECMLVCMTFECEGCRAESAVVEILIPAGTGCSPVSIVVICSRSPRDNLCPGRRPALPSCRIAAVPGRGLAIDPRFLATAMGLRRWPPFRRSAADPDTRSLYAICIRPLLCFFATLNIANAYRYAIGNPYRSEFIRAACRSMIHVMRSAIILIAGSELIMPGITNCAGAATFQTRIFDFVSVARRISSSAATPIDEEPRSRLRCMMSMREVLALREPHLTTADLTTAGSSIPR